MKVCVTDKGSGNYFVNILLKKAVNSQRKCHDKFINYFLKNSKKGNTTCDLQFGKVWDYPTIPSILTYLFFYYLVS